MTSPGVDLMGWGAGGCFRKFRGEMGENTIGCFRIEKDGCRHPDLCLGSPQMVRQYLQQADVSRPVSACRRIAYSLSLRDGFTGAAC